jgi:small acid-soluble spore protein D (minor alpha/beta-type SASP)
VRACGSSFGRLDNIDFKKTIRRKFLMSKNKVNIPEAKAALEKFKMEAANEVGVTLKQGYNGDITSKQAGSVGGQMVKKMVEAYENSIKNNG